MDFISKFKRQVAIRSFISILIPLLVAVTSWYISDEILNLATPIAAAISLTIGLVCGLISSLLLVDVVTKPMATLESIISFAAHSERGGQPLAVDSLKIGRELVTAQSLQIYDMASSLKPASNQPNQVASTTDSTIIDSIPIPIVGFDVNQKITVANRLFAEYVSKPLESLVGVDINDAIQLSFQGDNTLDVWLNNAKTTSVTATQSWECVRHSIDEDNHKQFDLVASFSSGSKSGTEAMLAIFDHTSKYNQDDQDISFVALAVHELRTPLTIMRGYIEVFEDELGSTLSPELADFMHKMHASSERLTAFVSNILNVARVEENQLSLKLKSEDWSEVLKSATDDLQLRAGVHDIQIELHIAEGIPPAAVDRISIHEVVNNLIDNAIKYSGSSKKIVVNSQLNAQGIIETSVQDFGIGIPESVINQLFQKYHRSHRSSTQISGTGLGLFLCKALISAHGGNIWVRSKEGEGSIFTFTIIPFDQISKEQAAGEDGIIRGAHGWIKNHSLYRN